MTEDPTQRIYRPISPTGSAPDAPTTTMPGPLNLAGSGGPETDDGATDDGATDSSTTDVLSLDELFDAPAPAPEPAPEAAPTWTAMPVVTVRSEPMTAAAPPAAVPPAPSRPAAGARLRSDATAAWDDTVRRTRAWLARDDNALMLLTALVAVCLILAVAAFAR